MIKILLRNQINSNKQGNVGVGKAIAYFVSQGFTVSVPLTDSQEYDLVVEQNGQLKRVQIKTTYYKRNNVYNVNLKTSLKTTKKNSFKRFNPNNCDLLYIYTEDENEYLIPTKDLEVSTSISLSGKYLKYKIN